MKLKRHIDNRWIIQKHISSSEIMDDFVNTLVMNKKSFDTEKLLSDQKHSGTYRGRSKEGSASSMGVRLSQAAFFMKGYTKNLEGSLKTFLPSPTTLAIRRNPLEKELYHFVEFFTMQFPHPNSKTNSEIKVFIGRVLSKLLTDERLQSRLYIDEMIWFIPFLTKMNVQIYEELIDLIINFRCKTFLEKKEMFRSIPEYEKLFSNVAHEMNYYFIRYFKDIVFSITPDLEHNEGRVLEFRHGNTKTFRNDAYASRKKSSGYITMKDTHKKYIVELLELFPFDDTPLSLASSNVHSVDDLKFDLFYGMQLEILSVLEEKSYKKSDFMLDIENMKKMSTQSGIDGKDFEISLNRVMKYFDKILSTNILSGAGKTDILCVVEDKDDSYKFNVEAKSRGSSSQSNVRRIERHATVTSAEYTIIIAPRFSRGNRLDIVGTNIVLLSAESLYTYMFTIHEKNNNEVIDFAPIERIIRAHMGSDISSFLDAYIGSF